MARKRIADTIKSGRKLVSDGAWGTLLQQQGLTPGECPEAWCTERPEEVLAVARSYVEAGADMIESNTFGGSRFKLALYNLAERTAEINEAGARLSRQAAGNAVWVIASMGPTGKMLLLGDVTEEELYEGFREQVEALEKGGADAVCIETMMALDEALLAVRAAREHSDCEIICTFTFERNQQGEYRTMMGVSPSAAATAARETGAHIIGTNCGNGIAGMIPIVTEMRAAVPDCPILVHANAGLPKAVNGVDVFPETPDMMAGQIPALLEAGADIVGGCCGTTPEHIVAMKNAVKQVTG